MPAKDPFSRLIELFDEKQFLADIHHLLHIDECRQPQTHDANAPTLLVPACIDQLFTISTPQSDALLSELLQWERPSLRSASPHEIAKTVEAVRERYLAFKRLEHVRTINDEVDVEIERVVQRALSEIRSTKDLSQGGKGKLKTYLTTVLSASKRQGKAILTRGRNLANMLRDYVAQVEFPPKLRELLDKKAALGKRLIPLKPGGQPKWFIISVLGAAGFLYPPAGVASFALSLTDP